MILMTVNEKIFKTVVKSSYPSSTLRAKAFFSLTLLRVHTWILHRKRSFCIFQSTKQKKKKKAFYLLTFKNTLQPYLTPQLQQGEITPNITESHVNKLS